MNLLSKIACFAFLIGASSLSANCANGRCGQPQGQVRQSGPVRQSAPVRQSCGQPQRVQPSCAQPTRCGETPCEQPRCCTPQAQKCDQYQCSPDYKRNYLINLANQQNRNNNNNDQNQAPANENQGSTNGNLNPALRNTNSNLNGKANRNVSELDTHSDLNKKDGDLLKKEQLKKDATAPNGTKPSI